MINKYGITKYNDYPDISEEVFKTRAFHNILLIDQPIDDESVLLGCANEETFNDMFLYAFDGFPYSKIYIKLHPETIDGKKMATFIKHLKNINF
ncbi:hypothetical protein GW796_08725 [archaeon]|nr:hypothetical protein [archaeon]NCQ51962.1 hypothetical protein [archaeon]